jgi:hypothetical protein
VARQLGHLTAKVDFLVEEQEVMPESLLFTVYFAVAEYNVFFILKFFLNFRN